MCTRRMRRLRCQAQPTASWCPPCFCRRPALSRTRACHGRRALCCSPPVQTCGAACRCGRLRWAGRIRPTDQAWCCRCPTAPLMVRGSPRSRAPAWPMRPCRSWSLCPPASAIRTPCGCRPWTARPHRPSVCSARPRPHARRRVDGRRHRLYVAGRSCRSQLPAPRRPPMRTRRFAPRRTPLAWCCAASR
jgi:hypothetical protein